MSNRVVIQPTKFENINPSSDKEGDRREFTIGVRVYDSYNKAYENTWETIPEDPLEILKLVCQSDDDAISDMISWVETQQEGIEIAGEWFEWEQIKEVITGES